jgi:hypothetical protein
MKSNLLGRLGGLMAVLAVSAVAQDRFFYTESGDTGNKQPYIRMGTFTLDGAGGFVGTEVFRLLGVTRVSPTRGTYTMDDLGAVFNFQREEASNDGESTVTISANVRAFTVAAGRMTGIRTDPGANAVFEVSKLDGAPTVRSRYVLSEDGVISDGQPFSAIAHVRVDSNGGVSGTLLRRGGGDPVTASVVGSLQAGADGIWTLTLTDVTVDTGDDRSPTAVVAAYYVVPVDQGRTLQAVRADGGAVTQAKLTAQ